jgi:pimeloyl-ACP methyl ester carboxylesterase
MVAAPVVLVHSGVSDAREWGRVLERLGPALDARTVDLPGRLSAVTVLEALPDRPVHLVGSSFGAQVCLEVALAVPRLVESLVLLAPALPDHDWSDAAEAYDDEAQRLLEEGDRAGAVELDVRTWAGTASPEVQALVRDMDTRVLDEGDDEHELDEDPPALDLAALEVPVTVAVGDADLPDFPEIARRVAGAAGGRLHVLAGAGHLLALERPDEIAELVSAHLRGGAAARG